jgi:hypothetical protein
MHGGPCPGVVLGRVAGFAGLGSSEVGAQDVAPRALRTLVARPRRCAGFATVTAEKAAQSETNAKHASQHEPEPSTPLWADQSAPLADDKSKNMRFQLTMIARTFEEGLKALRGEPADPVAAERAYGLGSRQLNRVPWERAWAARLKELFQLQQKLRSELDQR